MSRRVTFNLIHILTLLEALRILKSDNRCEFSNNIVSNLRDMWPEQKKNKVSQFQGSVERADLGIKNMLTTWMQTEKTFRWRYRALHSGIKMSTHKGIIWL